MAEEPDLVKMTIDVVAQYVAHNMIAPDDVPAFIAKTHSAIKALTVPEPETPVEAAAPEFVPAVTVRKSLGSPDHILSMIDGKPYKILKRHLASHGLTPAEYRTRYGLKADYPMVAPTYAAARRETAQKLGLGGRRKAATPAPAPEAVAADPTPAPAKAAAAPKAVRTKLAKPAKAPARAAKSASKAAATSARPPEAPPALDATAPTPKPASKRAAAKTPAAAAKPAPKRKPAAKKAVAPTADPAAAPAPSDTASS